MDNTIVLVVLVVWCALSLPAAWIYIVARRRMRERYLAELVRLLRLYNADREERGLPPIDLENDGKP